ncbi:MAG TPA: GNAT family N-acetyltransferase [Mesotoga infera]|nr:GNAT family N-acetyltransferase [Mesotoga infera]HRR45167.1 GNAT family N-acetyltransferase [Mesotoga sp.]HNS66211.1 GNAT family N-acetyltransferase [Mesotoga infera]HOI35296.1 GNAT family N-acetyltransferase [Mesotoga infera]HON28998.1 GNAT family N-acetyltransferase [Mesotoga infera]HPD39071.1 GNAT family N-acetyltransferase [Mesotoga infera]
MRRIPGNEWKMLIPFLSAEREFNVFMIGDIENTPPEAEHMEIFVEGELENPAGVLLRYYRFFIVYSSERMDHAGAAKIIKDFEKAIVLSGKADCIDAIAPHLREITKEEATMHLALLKEPNLEENDLPIRRATMSDAGELLALLNSIEEFRATEEESFLSSLESGTSRRYIVEMDGRIVSTAASTAESSDMAMIIGVATHKDYRKRGLASKVVSKLCSDLLNWGRTPCLFYDNPEAGKIYNRLGFREIGKWKILYFR